MPATVALRPALALLLVLLSLPAASAVAATYPGDVVVAPTPALRTLDGLDLAPDGTGAIVYTLQDGGVDHVFVSRLVNGRWGAPERLDGGLAAPSSQPAVAAADGGRVAVAFVNAGNLVAVTRAASAAGWVRQTVWSGGGAASPSLDLSVNRKGYLAFTAPGAGGQDVRAAFARDAGPWALVGAPIDANPGAAAGAGAGRAHVGASADGIGVVVWGEAGHVIARRVQGTRPSVVFADANAGLSLEGVGVAAADAPVVGVQDDDSFTGVAFRATFMLGGTPRSRVVYRRLRGSRFEGPTAVDLLPFSSGEGSVGPRIATVGTGQGLVVGSGEKAFHAYATTLRMDVAATTVQQIDVVPGGAALPYAVPAAATARKMLVAWQLTPAGGPARIEGRYFAETAFEPEQALSRPELGPTLAARGLLAAGDDSGDIAVAFVQDVPGAGPAIAVAMVDQPPGRFAVKRMRGWVRSERPVLAWTTSREVWGRYFAIAVDGVQIGVTGRRSFRPRTPLLQGAHAWQVTALDARGQRFAAPAATVKVDSVPPAVTTRLSGARRAGVSLRLAIRASDAPPPPPEGVPAILTSGLKAVVVDWGDGAQEPVRRGAHHAYARPGRYVLRVSATDRAGNRVTVPQRLKVGKPLRRMSRGRRAGPAR